MNNTDVLIEIKEYLESCYIAENRERAESRDLTDIARHIGKQEGYADIMRRVNLALFKIQKENF